jgi:serine/threonine protein kinase
LAARYRIKNEIGRGAMGRVYLAHDILLDRDVALKELMAPSYLTDEEREEVRERFNLEARAAARLTHPHVLTVHDIVISGDRQFIVMEYLEGKTLRQVLADRVFSPEELLSIAPMISEALDYAHSQGIIHRDIKPDNIFVLESGNIKVADFGIAKMLKVSDSTHTDVIMGTPNYIAPELVKGMAYDYRVDIFSLGVSLYELLTGIRPFDADNDYAIIYKVANEEPIPLDELRDDLPSDLVRVIHRSLEKSPILRYPSMKELKEDLMKARAELGMRAVGELVESFDKERALQSELEMAKDLEDDVSPDGEPAGESDFQRDKEWRELIAQVYHKEAYGGDIALSTSKRASWDDLEAMAIRGEPPSDARNHAREASLPGAGDHKGVPPVPRLPAPASSVATVAVAAPAKSSKLVDPAGAMHWSIVAIAAGVLATVSVALPWIKGDLYPSHLLLGITFAEGIALVVLIILALGADAMVLLGVGEPRRWASLMKILSLLSLLVVLLFFGLRVFGGVGYDKAAGIDTMDYVKGIGLGLWLALAGTVTIYLASRKVSEAT